jgi:hypothetical protein
MTLRQIRVKLAVVLFVTLLLSICLITQAAFIYGPSYWKWHARYIEFWRYLPAMLLCAVPLFGALWIGSGSRARVGLSIALLMLSMLAMQIVHIGLTVRPFSLSRVIYFVESPMSTSYFSDALRSMDHPTTELLAQYPGYMSQFYLHAQEKPPGPMLFFRTIIAGAGLESPDRTALIAGWIIGILATLNVPAVYTLLHTLTKDREVAFAGSVMMALCPGLILNFPMLDQLYAIGTCLLLITWIMALRSGKISRAVAFGAILSAAIFLVYHYLVLGFFLGVATLAFIFFPPKRPPEVVAQQALAAIGTMLLIYFAFYAITGFNAVETFRTALTNQSKLLPEFHRPYPKTIVFDLTDFALGAGWIPWVLAVTAMGNREIERSWRCWGALALAQIVLVALAGLLQAETARVWCFLLPLLVLPAAMELSRWPRAARVAVFAAMWLLVCLVGQNMTFMY